MDKLLFWLGIGVAQKGAGSKPTVDRHWAVSLVAGILIAVLRQSASDHRLRHLPLAIKLVAFGKCAFVQSGKGSTHTSMNK